MPDLYPFLTEEKNMLFKSEIFHIYRGKKKQKQKICKGWGEGKACLNCVKDNFPEGKTRGGEVKKEKDLRI